MLKISAGLYIHDSKNSEETYIIIIGFKTKIKKDDANNITYNKHETSYYYMRLYLPHLLI